MNIYSDEYNAILAKAELNPQAYGFNQTELANARIIVTSSERYVNAGYMQEESGIESYYADSSFFNHNAPSKEEAFAYKRYIDMCRNAEPDITNEQVLENIKAIIKDMQQRDMSPFALLDVLRNIEQFEKSQQETSIHSSSVKVAHPALTAIAKIQSDAVYQFSGAFINLAANYVENYLAFEIAQGNPLQMRQSEPKLQQHTFDSHNDIEAINATIIEMTQFLRVPVSQMNYQLWRSEQDALMTTFLQQLDGLILGVEDNNIKQQVRTAYIAYLKKFQASLDNRFDRFVTKDDAFNNSLNAALHEIEQRWLNDDDKDVNWEFEMENEKRTRRLQIIKEFKTPYIVQRQQLLINIIATLDQTNNVGKLELIDALVKSLDSSKASYLGHFKQNLSQVEIGQISDLIESLHDHVNGDELLRQKLLYVSLAFGGIAIDRLEPSRKEVHDIIKEFHSAHMAKGMIWPHLHGESDFQQLTGQLNFDITQQFDFSQQLDQEALIWLKQLVDDCDRPLDNQAQSPYLDYFYNTLPKQLENFLVQVGEDELKACLLADETRELFTDWIFFNSIDDRKYPNLHAFMSGLRQTISREPGFNSEDELAKRQSIYVDMWHKRRFRWDQRQASNGELSDKNALWMLTGQLDFRNIDQEQLIQASQSLKTITLDVKAIPTLRRVKNQFCHIVAGRLEVATKGIFGDIKIENYESLLTPLVPYLTILRDHDYPLKDYPRRFYEFLDGFQADFQDALESEEVLPSETLLGFLELLSGGDARQAFGLLLQASKIEDEQCLYKSMVEALLQDDQLVENARQVSQLFKYIISGRGRDKDHLFKSPDNQKIDLIGKIKAYWQRRLSEVEDVQDLQQDVLDYFSTILENEDISYPLRMDLFDWVTQNFQTQKQHTQQLFDRVNVNYSYYAEQNASQTNMVATIAGHLANFNDLAMLFGLYIPLDEASMPKGSHAWLTTTTGYLSHFPASVSKQHLLMVQEFWKQPMRSRALICYSILSQMTDVDYETKFNLVWDVIVQHAHKSFMINMFEIMAGGYETFEPMSDISLEHLKQLMLSEFNLRNDVQKHTYLCTLLANAKEPQIIHTSDLDAAIDELAIEERSKNILKNSSLSAVSGLGIIDNLRTKTNPYMALKALINGAINPIELYLPTENPRYQISEADIERNDPDTLIKLHEFADEEVKFLQDGGNGVGYSPQDVRQAFDQCPDEAIKRKILKAIFRQLCQSSGLTSGAQEEAIRKGEQPDSLQANLYRLTYVKNYVLSIVSNWQEQGLLADNAYFGDAYSDFLQEKLQDLSHEPTYEIFANIMLVELTRQRGGDFLEVGQRLLPENTTLTHQKTLEAIVHAASLEGPAQVKLLQALQNSGLIEDPAVKAALEGIKSEAALPGRKELWDMIDEIYQSGALQGSTQELVEQLLEQDHPTRLGNVWAGSLNVTMEVFDQEGQRHILKIQRKNAQQKIITGMDRISQAIINFANQYPEHSIAQNQALILAIIEQTRENILAESLVPNVAERYQLAQQTYGLMFPDNYGIKVATSLQEGARNLNGEGTEQINVSFHVVESPEVYDARTGAEDSRPVVLMAEANGQTFEKFIHQDTTPEHRGVVQAIGQAYLFASLMQIFSGSNFERDGHTGNFFVHTDDNGQHYQLGIIDTGQRTDSLVQSEDHKSAVALVLNAFIDERERVQKTGEEFSLSTVINIVIEENKDNAQAPFVRDITQALLALNSVINESGLSQTRVASTFVAVLDQLYKNMELNSQEQLQLPVLTDDCRHVLQSKVGFVQTFLNCGDKEAPVQAKLRGERSVRNSIVLDPETALGLGPQPQIV